MFTFDELRDVFHRSRTVEGIHGNQVLETVRLQCPQVFFHSGGLELEQACGVAPGEKFEGFFVVQGDFVFIQCDVFGFFDVFQACFYDGEGA